ncbi:N-glycosylase/DNA lyase [Nanoarchaeota archaeon]
MLLGDYKVRKREIEERLKYFQNLDQNDIFYELCFCLCTPQSSAKKCDGAIKDLIKKDFRHKKFNPSIILRKNGVRFHNNKSKHLLEMKSSFGSIQNNIDCDASLTRDYLVDHVKGLGLKESSHFLRNIGYENLAILDRHILKNLVKYRVINEIPKTLSRKNYLEIEEKFRRYSEKVKIPMDHLDLLFWSFETGEIFK